MHSPAQLSTVSRFEEQVHMINHRLTLEETKMVLPGHVPNCLFHSVVNFSLQKPLPLLCLEPDVVVHDCAIYAAPFKVR